MHPCRRGSLAPVEPAGYRSDTMHHSRPIAAVALLLTGVGSQTAAGAAPPDMSHLGEAHLQRVLRWTAAERRAAAAAARQLQSDLDAAIAAGSPVFRIPPGDYTDWLAAEQGNTGGHRCILSVVGAKGMRIEATGATFWKSGDNGRAIVFSDCRDCTVIGLTTDTLKSPFVQGIVSEIIPNGHADGWDRVMLDLEDGFFPAEHLTRANTIGRTFQLGRDGRLRVTPPNLGPAHGTAAPPGKQAWFYRGNALADGAVAVGDRLAVHVKAGYGGVAVIDCGGLHVEDLTVFSAAAFCVWEQGIRAPGGNVYRRMRIVPRSGATRLGVGAMDGFHSYNQARGPTLIDCEIARTCDDGINIHGFVNVVLRKLPGGAFVLASICGRDYDVGTELTLNQAPAMKPLGTAAVAAWEPFDAAEGMRLYTEMQQRYKEQYATTVRDVIRPEFNLVSFTTPVALDALDMATSHDYCGRGTRLTNVTVRDGCNRGALIKSPDAVIEESRFADIPWGGLFLATGITQFLEGGFPSNVRIRNNTFENCGERTFGHGPLWAGWGAISLSPCLPPHVQEAYLHLNPHPVYRDILIAGNRIVDTQGLPIFIGNTKGATVRDNVIVRPFQAPPTKLGGLDLTLPGRMETAFAPPVPPELLPVLRQPFYAVFVSGSEDVTLSGNVIEDAPPAVKGMLGIGPWTRNVSGQGD